MWNLVYKGKLLAIEKHSEKGWERAIRPPGVRLFIEDESGKILLTREFRHEQNDFDFRLPGGKVFDDLSDEFFACRADKNLMNDAVLSACKREAKEEAGIESENESWNILSKSTLGATVEWDLYYAQMKISDHHIGEQDLKEDETEHGIEIAFYTKEEILNIIQDGKIGEERTVAFLMSHIFA